MFPYNGVVSVTAAYLAAVPHFSLSLLIDAPVEVCFDAARDIDIHILSTAHTGEKAISGRTSGLISLGEQVEWRARHFGIWQRMTMHITWMNPPKHFRDEMLKGPFASIIHDHYFEALADGKTLMRDEFSYTAPFGWLGRLIDRLILSRYMRKLLEKRNKVVKKIAEERARDLH